MTIELVSKNDCVNSGDRNGKGKGRVDCSNKIYKGKMKRIDNRDRKKCHKCGRDGGLWHEFFVKGKREYLFLCSGCIEDVESGKG